MTENAVASMLAHYTESLELRAKSAHFHCRRAADAGLAEDAAVEARAIAEMAVKARGYVREVEAIDAEGTTARRARAALNEIERYQRSAERAVGRAAGLRASVAA